MNWVDFCNIIIFFNEIEWIGSKIIVGIWPRDWKKYFNTWQISAEIRTRYSDGSVKSNFKYRYVMQRVSHEISQFSVTNFSKQVTSVTFSLLYNHHLWSVLNHFFRVFFKNFEIFEMWFCLVNRGQLWLWINPCVSESREWLIFRLF